MAVQVLEEIFGIKVIEFLHYFQFSYFVYVATIFMEQSALGVMEVLVCAHQACLAVLMLHPL